MADKPKKLTDEQIVSIMNTDFDDAVGAPGGEISDERAKAYEYYMQEKFGDEDDEVSEVVTSDVAEVVDGIMPSLLRMFTTQENLVSFDPYGPEDEPGAEQSSDYVSYVFFKRNPAFEILYDAFWDALVQKTGIFKSWWDESKKVTTETYENLAEAELFDLVTDEEIEVEEMEEVEIQDEVSGQMVTLFNVTAKRTSIKGKVTVECVPPNEYRVSACGSMEGHEREITRADAVAMGFDKKMVWELPAAGETTDSSDEAARKDKSDDRKEAESTPDKSQELILLREGYKRIDVDGTGVPELYQVYTCGEKLLQKEPFDSKPFHTICPYPIPHKQVGRSAADKTMDIQRVRSTILRQILGNLYHTNNPGHAVWEDGLGENTMDDLLTTKVGRIARFDRPVGESYAPLTVPFMADASFPMLEYFDQEKKDRTGISSDSEGLSPEALKHVQQSVMAQSVDLSKMKVETVARIFAETGLKSLFLHIHELVLKHQQKADVVKLRGQWVRVNPTEWRERKDMTVNIGLGISTREQSMIYLEGIWNKQVAMVEGGGMNLTVTPKNIYNTAVEMVKNANYKRPDMFFQDPGDQKAPPPSDEQEELRKREIALQERQQQLDQERQQVKAAELQLKAQAQDLKHQEEMLKLQEKMEEREDKYAAENEKLRTKIMEARMADTLDKANQILKEAETAASIRESNARRRNLDAQTEVARREPPAEMPSVLDQEKKRADIELVEAKTDTERAKREQVEVQTQAERVEIRAAEAGIDEMLEAGSEDDDGGSEETE